MSDGGWVTEPDAIFTAIKLKAIRPGDRIRFRHGPTRAHLSHFTEGEELEIHSHPQAEVGAPSWWERGQDGLLLGTIFSKSGGECGVAEENIAAWKPKYRTP